MAEPPRGARHPFAGRRILLGVTGGIAAYKSIQLARDLAASGARVDVVLSTGALEFVKPLSFEALTGRQSYSDLFASGEALTHIRLAREADVLVVAPATANFMARAAAGMADDLLTAVLLATRAPVLICPAMNDRMFAHSVTHDNLNRLVDAGYRIVGPEAGPLAWGEGEGLGRMTEPATIMAHVGRALEGTTAFTGRRIMVTAGPTREAIDPVRFIGNRSSGRMGYALAEVAWRRGAEVVLISGPSSLPPPPGVELRRVETAEDLRKAVAAALPDTDVLLMAAAVADFRPIARSESKLKRNVGSSVSELRLEPAPDVLRSTRELRSDGCVIVGFALETDAHVENARGKLEDKGLDLIVLNDATEEGAGFDVETNRVTILDPVGGEQKLPLLPKKDVAEAVLDRVAPLLTLQIDE
ncbi:MAG TPA: bifunctional phosphopantothenoylcysteine decarboxylase/phosphopantothenate--cysteine ligase CoaBC [Longimicrobiaceae bacterium]|nr:bifunctional phosphopantothenoylcysteine decarboxylase/phosphopantothenate--cysteine ligase CoaBC [Longimicrobiaceae bacterium]